MTNRRDLLLIGMGLFGVAAGWQAWLRRPRPFEFDDLPDLPGWRMLESGRVSPPAGNAFLTIGRDAETSAALSIGNLEDVLYRTERTPPIAVFSDFFCPFCRVLTSRLANRPDLPVTWHELPLLGPPSEFAARALVSADFQGGYIPFTQALIQRGFRPSVTMMDEIAESIGLNGTRLVRDMNGPNVETRLHETRRAAATLGIYGTPGMTIGRTLVMGEISMIDLDRLISLETS